VRTSQEFIDTSAQEFERKVDGLQFGESRFNFVRYSEGVFQVLVKFEKFNEVGGSGRGRDTEALGAFPAGEYVE